MTPEDLAGIMTYVRNNFGNATGDVVTIDMAKAAMEISAARKNAGKSVDRRGTHRRSRQGTAGRCRSIRKPCSIRSPWPRPQAP